MVVMIAGNGKFDYRLHRGRIEYEILEPLVGDVPNDGLNIDCLAVIGYDDHDCYDFGHGIMVGVVWKGKENIAAGWFSKKDARQYREEMSKRLVPRNEIVLCLGKLRGGALMQYKKGPMRLSGNLSLDLVWPIQFKSDWYYACDSFLNL